jgi:hypothetical protein
MATADLNCDRLMTHLTPSALAYSNRAVQISPLTCMITKTKDKENSGAHSSHSSASDGFAYPQRHRPLWRHVTLWLRKNGHTPHPTCTICSPRTRMPTHPAAPTRPIDPPKLVPD